MKNDVLFNRKPIAKNWVNRPFLLFTSNGHS